MDLSVESDIRFELCMNNKIPFIQGNKRKNILLDTRTRKANKENGRVGRHPNSRREKGVCGSTKEQI